MTDPTPEDTEALRARLGAKDGGQAEPEPTPGRPTNLSTISLTFAVIWAIAAVIFGGVLLAAAQDVTYGADAYTGIQNAVMLAVRGIAFLLFGSAAIGLIIATRADRG